MRWRLVKQIRYSHVYNESDVDGNKIYRLESSLNHIEEC